MVGSKKLTAGQLVEQKASWSIYELAALLRIAETVSEPLELDEVIQRTVEIIREHFSVPLAIAIYLLDESQQQLQLVGGHALSKSWLRWCQRLDLTAPVVGEVQRTGQVMVLDTLEDLEQVAGVRIRRHLERLMKNYASSVHVPLQTKRRILGVLSVAGRGEREFSHESVALLNAVGGYIGVAIDRAQRYAAEQQRADYFALARYLSEALTASLSLEDILSQICRKLAEVIAFDDISVTLIKEDGSQATTVSCEYVGGKRSLKKGETVPLSQTDIAWVYQHRQVYVNRGMDHDASLSPMGRRLLEGGIKSSLLIPLISKDAVMGTLNLGSRRQQAFSEADIALLEAISGLLAIALENAELFSRQTRQTVALLKLNDDLQTMHQVSLAMQSTLDLGRLLKEITDSLVHRLGYNGAGIFLLEPRERVFVGAAYSADQPGLQQKVERLIGRKITDLRVQVQPERSPAAQRFLDGQVLVSHDLSYLLSPLFSKAVCRAVQKLRGLRSFIVVPLMAKEETVGGLFVTSDKMDLSPRDRRMLITFASQAAIAIANARLFEQEKKRVQQLALINQIGQKVASTPDLKTLAQYVAQDLHESFHYESVELWLVDEATDDSVLWAHAGELQGLIPPAARQKNSDGIIGYVVRSGHTYLCNDVCEDPWYIPAHLTGIKSELCAPIRIAGKVIGVINLESRQFNMFDESDVHVLETICRQIVHPIENALTLKFYKSILDRLPVATIILDTKLRVVLVSRKFNDLFGVSDAQAVGELVSKFVPQGEAGELIDQVRREGGLREVEFSLSLPGVRDKILRMVISGIDLGDSESRTLVMLEDVSEKVHLVEHLIQSEKRAAMGELAVTIAHELGNPLGIISSALQFVQDQLRREREHVPEELALIADNVERMHELLKSLSELSGPELLCLTSANIHQALMRVLAFIRREAESHRVTIKTKFDESVPLCRVDIKQLKQVFLNLFKNALEAMPQGGRLSVRTHRQPVDLLSDQEYVMIEVSDTGSGIPESELAAIFKPFYSTKERGTGLGLYLCQQIVEKHQGRLTVRSQPGKGTTFIIRLPITQGEADD